ncbi:hypothetical protein Tco_0922313 [Tanacetum coccineum]|uniref:Reverse transcriptase Ty1/copia-type domain-containing protein n=1 Tax=Tanacetum coccineum TaxID=301880 RepID=A0ABQ5CYP1_9ASTR
MAALTFADSHNMVAYMEKLDANADFAEIVDFLNVSPINYALTVSPTVYVSYIEQFWSTVKIKIVNNETQICAKVNGKTIVIIESSMRRDLHFDDEDGLQVTQKDDGIFISQDKYVDEILKKFGFSTVKTASTPMETSKPLMKDENAKDVDVHLYRSMIGSLMYLTSSRPDIMFADSPFDLEAYTNSDYAGASLDRKSKQEDVNFLDR